MKRTVIDNQTLMVRIKSPSWVACGPGDVIRVKNITVAEGHSDVIPGKEWYVGEFTSQEEADKIFGMVKQRYQEEKSAIHSWMKEPIMTIDWETTDTRIIDK